MDVRIVVDYPPTSVFVNVDSSASLALLKEAFAKACPTFNASSLGSYNVFCARYGSDVSAVEGGDTTSLSSHVTPYSTVFFRAPAELKPPTRKQRKAAEKGEEKKEDKKDAKATKDPYKGLTPENALDKLKGADGPRQKVILEYIDIQAKKIVESKQFKNADEKVVLQIVSSDSLNIKEVDLFDGVLAWAKAKQPEGKEGLQKLMSSILPHIRFLTMSTEDIATKVVPSGLLGQFEVLDLFTYMGTRDHSGGVRIGDNIKRWKTDKRKPRKSLDVFKWSNDMKHTGIQLSDDGLTATSTSSTYMCVWGDTEWKDGVHEYTIEVKQMKSQSYSIMVGATPSSFTEYSRSQMIGYRSHIPGWSFACAQGQVYNNGKKAYTTKVNVGDRVGVRIDLDQHTIEFKINGESRGVAYDNVTGPVRPAVSFYQSNNGCSLRFED